MNGHAGNIGKSYEYYLKILNLESNKAFAICEIAWIAFSHERNTIEAKRIIDAILKKHQTLDLYLLKANIAKFENNHAVENENILAYFQMLRSINYGDMYNKYNALIYANDEKTDFKALEIAKLEINHRLTPDSYDLLAWSYFDLGDYRKAQEIAEKHIVGKSFKPQLNYHLAMIYKAKNKKEKLFDIKKELLKSIYELGPNLEQ